MQKEHILRYKHFSFAIRGANDDGSHLYCTMYVRNLNKSIKKPYVAILKGRYDFDKGYFTVLSNNVVRYSKSYNTGGRSFNTHDVEKVLRNFLQEYDWI